MGLMQDLIDAKLAGENIRRQKLGIEALDEPPQALLKETELIRDAIINFLTSEELVWTINKLKASIELETLEIEDIGVDVAPKTLLGPHAPAVGALKSLGVNIEAPIKKAASAVSKDGASTSITSRKDGGKNGNITLATGHAYIGEDDIVPNSDTQDPDNDFTEVRLMRVPKDLL